MSSKASKMAKEIAQVKKSETQNVEFKVSMSLQDRDGNTCKRDCFMLLTGVPKDLPDEMMQTLEKTVRMGILDKMNAKQFIETYEPGHNRQDSEPLYVNGDKVEAFRIDSVTRL